MRTIPQISLFLLLCNIVHASETPPPVLCTYYTPSHKELATQWLLPSVKDDVEVIIRKGIQQCTSATYRQSNWTKTTRDKVHFIIKTIENHMGGIVIFADADITLFRPVVEELTELLTGKEFIAQIDRPGKICSGFFALRANKKTLKLWRAVLQYMNENHNISDQDALHHFLTPNRNVFDIVWDFLPITYFGCGTFKGKGGFWRPGKNVRIPDNPAMFHANYTRFCNKIAVLTYVKSMVESRNKKKENG